MDYRTALLLLTLLAIFSVSKAQEEFPRRVVSKDIYLIQLSEHAYVHVSYAEMPPWGRIGSNGLIICANGEGLLFDTPVTDSLTAALVQWIRDSLHVRITGFVPNHWHNDCMGGLAYVKAMGIPSYANAMTRTIAQEKDLPLPDSTFTDSLTLKVGGVNIACKYLGAGHTRDNIVAWIASEQILFGGCMVKELKSKGLGNTVDADLDAWPATITRVQSQFPDARIVVPGHGSPGGRELLEHTLELLKKSE